MKTTYYLDTAIWRDYFENRVDRLQPLGDFAFELFRKIRLNREIVFFSDLVIDELLTSYEDDQIKNLLEIFEKEGLLLKVNINHKQILEAKKLRKKFRIPHGDCLHAILARDNDAIMITRDKHFEELQNIVMVKKPEELI